MHLKSRAPLSPTHLSKDLIVRPVISLRVARARSSLIPDPQPRLTVVIMQSTLLQRLHEFCPLFRSTTSRRAANLKHWLIRRILTIRTLRRRPMPPESPALVTQVVSVRTQKTVRLELRLHAKTTACTERAMWDLLAQNIHLRKSLCSILVLSTLAALVRLRPMIGLRCHIRTSAHPSIPAWEGQCSQHSLSHTSHILFLKVWPSRIRLTDCPASPMLILGRWLV